MPNDNDAISKAKAALAHAKATFPNGSNGGHDTGVAFAQAHNADHQGSTMSNYTQAAIPTGEAASIKSRQDNIKQYMDATQGK